MGNKIELSAYRDSRRQFRRRARNNPALRGLSLTTAHTFLLGVGLGKGLLDNQDATLLRHKVTDWIRVLRTDAADPAVANVIASLTDLLNSGIFPTSDIYVAPIITNKD